MKRATAAAWILVALAATVVALRAPLWAVALVACAALALWPRLATAATIALPALLYAALLAALDPAAAWTGFWAGGRLGTAMALNLAIVTRSGPERLLEALRLPATPTAWLAAVLLAASDVGRDARAFAHARRLEGAWPRGWRRLGAAAPILPAIAERALRRATTRAHALRLAGHATAPAFVPIVAMAALIVADRVALAAVPNIKLTYVAVFTAGLAFGWRAGVAAAALGMAVTDFLFSGLYLPVYVNVPAMALLALAGASLAPWRRRLHAPAWTAALAVLGAACTLAFSVASDTLTVLLTPEGGQTWRAAILGGLAFNAVAAAVNAVLFATAVPAVVERLDATPNAARFVPTTA